MDLNERAARFGNAGTLSDMVRYLEPNRLTHVDPGMDGRFRVAMFRYAFASALALAGCEGATETHDIPEWRLADEPAVEIGVVEGDANYQFHQIRGVAQLSDGRIAVVNAGSHEVRLFSRQGQHLFSVGGAGGGPGEFQAIASLDVLPGDSLLVFDAGNRRVSVFEPSGEFARSWTVESLGRGLFPERAASLDDGSLVIFHFRGHMPGDPSGALRFSAPAVRYSATGDYLNEIADIPGDEWYSWDSDQGRVLMFLPFGRSSHSVVDRSRLLVGASEAFEFRVFGAEGEELDPIRLERAPVPVTSSDVERFESGQMDALDDPDSRARRRLIHADIPYPDFMPAHSSVLADHWGSLWVEEYRPHDDGTPRWTVIDQNGVLLAQVAMPERFEPSVIMDNLVIRSPEVDGDRYSEPPVRSIPDGLVLPRAHHVV